MIADPSHSVLIIQRSIPPDHSASGRLALELAEYFAKNGWCTTLLATRTPSDAAKKEKQDDLTIYRTPCLPFTRRNLLLRALATASIPPFLFAEALSIGRHDVIITLSDPPLLACLGMCLSILWKSPHIHWSQDLYPEVAESAGVFRKNGILASLLRNASTMALRQCAAIVAPGRCMAEKMHLDRNIPSQKIHVVSNWASPIDEKAIHIRVQELRSQWNPKNKFVVMYSGNFGMAHDFMALLEAATILHKNDVDVLFLLSGTGPREREIREELSRRNIDNVIITPPVPYEDLDAWLCVGDIHVVTLRFEMEGLVVPSKVYAITSAGRPTLFLGPNQSESAQILKEIGSGKVVSDGSSLANEILFLKNHPETIASMRRAAQKAASQFTLPHAGERFLKISSAVLNHAG